MPERPSASTTFIGFPPPLLGPEPWRLPVVGDAAGLIALEKPLGVSILPDNWFTEPHVAGALTIQAQNGKPELERLGIGAAGPWALFNLEPEVSGLAVFVKDAAEADLWTNGLGSGWFEFSFELWTRQRADLDEISCELPLARHFDEPRMVVSHTTGRKTVTTFNFRERVGPYSLWQARTPYYRLNQVAIHAAEVGLGVLGDLRYANEAMPGLSAIKRHLRPKPDEPPIYPAPAIHLAAVAIVVPGEDPLTFAGEPPKRWQVLEKRLREAGGRS